MCVCATIQEISTDSYDKHMKILSETMAAIQMVSQWVSNSCPSLPKPDTPTHLGNCGVDDVKVDGASVEDKSRHLVVCVGPEVQIQRLKLDEVIDVSPWGEGWRSLTRMLFFSLDKDYTPLSCFIKWPRL